MQSILSFLRSRIAARKSKSASQKGGFFSRLFRRGKIGKNIAGRSKIQTEIPTPISSTRHLDEFSSEIEAKMKIGIASREEITARNYAQLQKHLVYKGKIEPEVANEKFKIYIDSDDQSRGDLWLQDKEEFSEDFSEWDLH